MPTALPELLDTQQLAEHLKISTRHVRRLANAQKIPAPLRIGNACRWRLADVQQFLTPPAAPVEML